MKLRADILTAYCDHNRFAALPPLPHGKIIPK
jgi:hypothetical protein